MSNILSTYQRLNHIPISGIMDIDTIRHIQSDVKVSDIAMANFLGQLHVESNGFKARRESLDYSIKGLIDTFAFFRRNTQLAESYGRTTHRAANQQMIANIVYDDKNRSPKFKLGNTQVGDGWKYRGGFGIQTTGRANYSRLSIAMRDPLILSDPDAVIEMYYFNAAKFYFDDKKLWHTAGLKVSEEITKILTKSINGGMSHLDRRHEMTVFYYNIIKSK